MARTGRWLPLLSAALLAVGCTKTQSAPPPPEDGEEELAAAPDDGSDLSQFRKKHRKVRKHKRTRPANPPSRKDGLTALEEGKLLLEEAEFRPAEAELRVAAAAGVDGADELLLRVRNEIASEDHIVAAQKKIAAKDWEGAKGELTKIPDGFILSDLARALQDKVEKREADTRKEIVDRASKKFQEPEDAATEPPVPPDAAAPAEPAP